MTADDMMKLVELLESPDTPPEVRAGAIQQAQNALLDMILDAALKRLAGRISINDVIALAIKEKQKP